MGNKQKQPIALAMEKALYEKLKEFEQRGIDPSTIGWFQSMGKSPEDIKKMEEEQ